MSKTSHDTPIKILLTQFDYSAETEWCVYTVQHQFEVEDPQGRGEGEAGNGEWKFPLAILFCWVLYCSFLCWFYQKIISTGVNTRMQRQRKESFSYNKMWKAYTCWSISINVAKMNICIVNVMFKLEKKLSFSILPLRNSCMWVKKLVKALMVMKLLMFHHLFCKTITKDFDMIRWLVLCY